MRATKHTQGPWIYWPECLRDGGMVIQYGTGQYIAAPTTYHFECVETKTNAIPALHINLEQTKANARLIAAAPELLEALKVGYAETMDYIQRNHLSGSENNQWLVLARAAIAKATGEHHE